MIVGNRIQQGSQLPLAGFEFAVQLFACVFRHLEILAVRKPTQRWESLAHNGEGEYWDHSLSLIARDLFAQAIGEEIEPHHQG